MISVIIPAYNAARTIGRCLASLEGQAGLAEVIVVDDASEDQTGALAARAPGMTVVRHALNRGPAAARNLGVAHASGDLLVFLDSDAVVTDRDWLMKHAAAHVREERIVGGGVI